MNQFSIQLIDVYIIYLPTPGTNEMVIRLSCHRVWLARVFQRHLDSGRPREERVDFRSAWPQIPGPVKRAPNCKVLYKRDP